MADEKLEIAIKAVNEASRALKDVQKDLGGLDDASKKASGGIGKLSDSAKKAAAVGLGALEGALIFSVKAAIEAEQVMAKTEAVIKSTGGAAGLTADEVSDLAGQFSNLSGIDDELIQSAENVLLTFTSIGRDVFPQAMEAALNMSVALGTDLQGAVIMVGKALQDPITGLTALRRAGVNVNTEMKNTVKAMVAMGDVAGAQAFILKELETEFGGVAEAAGDTLAGKLGKAEVAIGNLAEKIGGALVPVIGEAADAALNLITMTERIDDVFVEHEEQIRATSDGYAAYQEELFRSAVVVGKLTQGQLDYIEAGVETQETVDRIIISLGGLTETTYNAQLATDAYAHGMTEADFAAQAFTGTTQGETVALQELLTATDAISIGMNKYSNELLFNKAAADLDAGAALQLGLALGVVDEKSIIATAALDGLKQKYDTNKDGAISAAEAAGGYTQAVLALSGAINAIPDRTVRIHFEVDPFPNIPGPHEGPIPFQHGGLMRPGQIGLVGEAGPELFMSRTGGTVISTQQFGEMINILRSIAGGLGRPNITVNAGGGSSASAIADSLDAELARRARAARQSGAAGLGRA